jgi:hypothetical protein
MTKYRSARQTLNGFLALAMISATVLATSVPAMAKHKNTKEAIAAGVIGLAVGAALSHKHQHNKEIYYQGYQPYYPPQGYNDYYARSFSPSPGVICYDAQRACYDRDGTFSNRWMRAYYGSK